MITQKEFEVIKQRALKALNNSDSSGPFYDSADVPWLARDVLLLLELVNPIPQSSSSIGEL